MSLGPGDPATTAPVRVAEVLNESAADEVDAIPWHLAPESGRVVVQLRTTVRRVGIGAGLARRPELIESVRSIPGFPGLITSAAGGTFIMGGEGWMGMCAVGAPGRGQPMPLDWMMAALTPWFDAALTPLGLLPTVGRVEGAWCPGFSDIAVGGRKLIGLGFRMTRGLVVARGVMPVTPITDDDFRILAACHRLIDVDLRADAATSICAATRDPTWTTARMIRSLSEAGSPGR